jgi:hypothetical protein
MKRIPVPVKLSPAASPGGGKYEEEAFAAREATGASALVLVVVDGKKGNGMSVLLTSPSQYGANLVRALRMVADDIESSLP